MKRGDVVIHLSCPFTYGLGTITSINEIGWLEIDWTNNGPTAHPAAHLELADTWEHQQVERALTAPHTPPTEP